MIKFFRYIRQSMINQNSTKKYLLYAIGEIILVVIGILIALSINNWNENRKDSIEEKAVLESLDENLKLAKKQSITLLDEEISLKKGLIAILGIDTNYNEMNINTISDSIYQSALWEIQSDVPVINSYLNLKNTNKIDLIKSKTIKEKFTDLEFRLNKLNDILEDRLSVHQIRIDAILENEVNFIPLVKSNIPSINISKEPKNNYAQLLKNKRTRNLLGMKLTFTQDVIAARENLDNEIQNLIGLIQLELSQK